MSTVNAVSQLLIYFIECFVYWRIMSVLDAKINRKYLVLAPGILSIIMIIKDLIFSKPALRDYLAVGTVVLLAYTLTTYLLLFRNSFLEKLVWWCIYCLGNAIIELFIIFILKLALNKSLATIDSDQESLYVIMAGKLLFLVLFEIIIRKRKCDDLKISISYAKELTVIILFNIVLLLVTVFIFSNKQTIINELDHVILFIFGVIFLITIYTVILIFRLEKKTKEEIETQLRLQKIELELKLNEDMIQVTDNLRKLRHDMNNHIGLIKALVKEKKFEDVEEYINQIYEDVEIANELVITGNKTLSVLLNAKKSLAKSKNIDFYSMVAASDLKMQNKDICSLLGNILDNAIEAADKSMNKKYVQLMIQKTDNECIISCENSFGMKPLIKKGRFVTMKENMLLHGIGIENIKTIVSKYNGEISFDYDEEVFNVRVVMPI